MIFKKVVIKENKVKVTLGKNGIKIRTVTLEIGNEYVINPISTQVKKNRNRKVIYKGYESDRYGGIAKVQYVDTNRPGKVELDYLDYINKEY